MLNSNDNEHDDRERCIHCGEPATTTNECGDWICDDCASELYVHCEQCGDLTERDDAIADYAGNEYCPYCAGNYLYTCEHCGELVHADDAITVSYWRWTGCIRSEQHDTYCPDCASEHLTTCVCCDEYVHIDNVTFDRNGEPYCEDCANEHLRCCDNCNEYFRLDDGEYNDDTGEWYCNNCVDNYNGGLSYHTTRARRFYGEPDNARYFGVEIEHDNGNALRDCVVDLRRELGDFAELKHDGSLNRGYEIATMPASLEYHQTSDWMTRVQAIASEHGFKSHDTSTCGLHVHVSRLGLGRTWEERDYTVAKMILLVYRFYYAHLIPFSRRNGDRASQWASDTGVWYDYQPDDSRDQHTDKAKKHIRGNGRYVALNCRPDYTVEFRIFRGSLIPATILASIELCDAISEYALTHTAPECCAATWDDVITVKEYKALPAYNDLRAKKYDESRLRVV